MEKPLYETPQKRNGVTVPVEFLEMKKDSDSPDLFAHFHEFLEILYLKEGDMCVWLNDKLFDFHCGDLVVINSNETHRLVSNTPESEYAVLKFTPRLLYSSQESAIGAKYILPFIMSDSTQPRVFRKEFIDSTEIPAYLDDAMREWNEDDIGSELALKADVLKIFTVILRCLNSSGINVTTASAGNNTYNIINEILEYINNNFTVINEKDAADKFGISYSYFSRSFKQIMKMSFKEYVNYLKINEAIKLLLTTDKSIAQLADELAFSSPSHFINVFRKFKDCSPKQFKKNMFAD